jgi:hypothetical protein
MLRMKSLSSFVAVGAVLVSAACGDSSKSMNPTAPSAMAAATLSSEIGDANAESGATGKGGNPGKPDNPGNGNGNGNDKGDDKGKSPSTPTPPAPAPLPVNPIPEAPVAPTTPVGGKVEIEGLISAIAGASITVNGQAVAVPLGTVIRHGSRAVAFSELSVGDRVHVKAVRQSTGLEATEVKLQNSGPGDDDGDDDLDGAGTVRVAVLDAIAAEVGANTAAFRVTRIPSATLPLTSPLVVTFTLTGTATNGTDYSAIPQLAVFAAGQATVDVMVTPHTDALIEGPESVILTLGTVAPYATGSPSTGTAVIADAPIATPAASRQ